MTQAVSSALCDRSEMWMMYWINCQSTLLSARVANAEIVSSLRTDVARFAGISWQYQCHCGHCGGHGQSSAQAQLQDALDQAVRLQEALRTFFPEEESASDTESPDGSQESPGAAGAGQAPAYLPGA